MGCGKVGAENGANGLCGDGGVPFAGGDGEVAAVVVGDEIGFLEESAAQGVLRVVGAAAEGEVVLGVADGSDRVGDVEVEGAVGEGDDGCGSAGG